MTINRREIFAKAHFNARLRRINTGNRQSYAYWFASALRHEYAKLRLEQERLVAIRKALPPPVPPSYSLNSPYTRRLRIGGKRNTLAVGA